MIILAEHLKNNKMEKKYEITKELKLAAVEFLTTYANYEKNLELLKDQEKLEFNEEEINDLLNLLGSFRLRDVFHIVERFKIEVIPLKSQEDEPANNTFGQAG